MRILTHVIELSRLGGIEVNLVEDVRALVGRGHEVHVVHGPVQDGTGDLEADLLAAGAHLHGPHRLALDPRRAPLDVASYLPSARLAARLKPDVLWLHRFEQAAWAQATARPTGVPIVCQLHHAPNYRPWVQRVLARGIAQFVAVSHFTRQQWVDSGLAPESVRVLHNAVRGADYPVGGLVERAATRADLGLPADARIALFYGRFTREKGVDLLLDAWGAIEDPAAHLVLVPTAPGPGPDVAARIDALVAAGRATCLAPRRDVVPLLHAADVVVLLARAEPFGRVALEALMTGRPAVATARGGVVEIFPADLERFLVPPGDAAALTRTLGQTLAWRSTEAGLGERCAAAARDRFPFDRRVQELERLLLEGSRAASAGPATDRPWREETEKRTA